MSQRPSNQEWLSWENKKWVIRMHTTYNYVKHYSDVHIFYSTPCHIIHIMIVITWLKRLMFEVLLTWVEVQCRHCLEESTGVQGWSHLHKESHQDPRWVLQESAVVRPWPDHHSLCTLEASAGQYPSQLSMCVETVSSVGSNHHLSAGYLNIFLVTFIFWDKFKL